MDILLIILIGYLFGSIHGSQIIGKLRKVDIKGTGLKNAGASNTTMLLGWKYGIVVALIDILKGTAAVLLVQYLLPSFNVSDSMGAFFIYLSALSVVVGHNFPFTMRFQGGKGTASAVGVMFAIHWQLALVCIGFLLIGTFVSSYLVLGVLLMYAAFLAGTFLLYGLWPTMIALILFLLSLYMHMENYQRIYYKQEKKVFSFFTKRVD
ncbi:Glycerol-3-phosphate 1-O-acyltransferase [Lentibacillus sp. JNUCC-1]|uniref:glycerol-3-phosphate acyltransferase n=1 Tax=Lentibacillus sp. JNUCC-1 TaxID=2654513 RepID=UPI0012E80838|nr:glycerol-3-phosphate acyltransferase [Lentibacillus sp. JNUCC-1]MUV38445.1 Glycerol-3-phosphate 1-O-acyltransferase [Lentibacillus sp. JNUCC-1]